MTTSKKSVVSSGNVAYALVLRTEKIWSFWEAHIMRSARAQWLLLACLCTLAGCYEDEATITLNPDGSGTIEQTLLLSERMIVGLSKDAAPASAPGATKERILQSIGSAFEVTSLTQEDRPDGGRLIQLGGRFKSADQFFLSKYCKDQLKLSLTPMAGGKAAVYYDWSTKDSDTSMSIEQMYGLAKGLHIIRSLRLPATVEKTNGRYDAAAKRVSWEIDLRDREALSRTKAFAEGPDKGQGVAVFSASTLSFALPLRAPASAEEAGTRDPNQAGLVADVVSVSVYKSRELKKNDLSQQSYTEVTIELRRQDARRSIRHEAPVLVSLSDDVGRDLVRKNASGSPGQMRENQKTTFLRLKGDAPGSGAKKVKNLQGYVQVADNIVTEAVTVPNVMSLVGKETTGNAVLDKLHFQVKSVNGNRLAIAIDGGDSIMDSIVLLKEGGAEMTMTGSSGSGNEYTYWFPGTIPASAACKLTVIVSQTKVKVPFALEEVDLP
jgi:uncharacterized protein YodC (DUF2158 family)